MTEEEKNTEVAADAPAEEAAPAEEKKEEAPAEAPVADAGADVEVPEKFKKIVSEIETMSVMDLAELVKVFEAKFGVSASAVAVAGPAAGDGADEGSSTVNVKLAAAGDQKIAVIKVIKEALGLGLKEAKDLVDAAPEVLKTDMPKADAEELKKKIEDAGGKVEFA